VYVGLIGLGVIQDRFFCYWLPPFCALAATVVQIGSSRLYRTTLTMILGTLVAYQLWTGVRGAQTPMIAGVRPAGAIGYEEAAQYVVDHRLGETVLYSAAVDTGYFVFFVRKHDPQQEMIVLRSDKLLTTSKMDITDFERRVQRPEAIPPMLQRYGVGYVVIEDRPYGDGPLRWLQQIVQTPAFELRRRIPIGSSVLRLGGATLSIYEYRDRTSADRDATLAIGVPMMNDVITVRLAELRPRIDASPRVPR
jgi:hypothetical protein